MNKVFQKLNVFTHTIYQSDGRKFIVWENKERKNKLYTIKYRGGFFNIYGPENNLLAENLASDKAVKFIEIDMNMGSPLPNSEIVYAGKATDEINVEVDNTIESKTERIIREAAKRHGDESVGASLLRDLSSRKRIDKELNGTVKKKRKIDVSDLDSDD